MTLILKDDEYDYGKEFYLFILQTWSLPGQGLHSTFNKLMTLIWNMVNMIMEKNFTWLYYNHEAYLDRVYIQQINEWLQEGMRDYYRKWRITRLLN